MGWVCIVMPLQTWSATSTGQVLAVALGVVLIAFFWLPTAGNIEINTKQRSVAHREPFFGRIFHVWRLRSRSVELPAGTVVVIGTWLSKKAFPRCGAYVKQPDGGKQLIYEAGEPITSALALDLKRALEQVSGVNVELIHLDEAAKEAPWIPQRTQRVKPAVPIWLSLVLPWTGLFASAFTTDSLLLIFIGIASYMIQLTVFIVWVKGRSAELEERTVLGLSLAFSAIQFAAFYAVLTLVGRSIWTRH